MIAVGTSRRAYAQRPVDIMTTVLPERLCGMLRSDETTAGGIMAEMRPLRTLRRPSSNWGADRRSLRWGKSGLTRQTVKS